MEKTTSCIICKVITINDEEGQDNDKPKEGAEEDVAFLFKILLEIPPNPGINLVVDGNLINCDHLLLLKSNLVQWCDQCNVAIHQARKLYHQISEATRKFRRIQQEIVKTLQNCIQDDDSSSSDNVENYKAIWRKLCLQNEGRFNKFEYPFIVQKWVSKVQEPEPRLDSIEKSDGQKKSSNCHGDKDDGEDELPCKNEDVKEEEKLEGMEGLNKGQQRILLIFPKEEGGNEEDGDSDSLSSGVTSQGLSSVSDDGEEEIIESSANSPGLKGDGENEDDPLAENLKEEPTEPKLEVLDQSQDNIQEDKSVKHYCTVCKIVFKTKDNLNRHNKRHHSGSNKLKPVKSATPSKFACIDPQCHKYFKTSAYLKRHLQRCHPQIPVPSFLKVSTFHKTYPELYAKIVKNPDTNLFHCPYSDTDTGCLKTFKLKKTAEYHIRCKHLGEPGIYPCTWAGSTCTRTFSVWNNYQSHMDRHKGVPRWKCDQCDKQFYARNTFVSHKQREHEDGRNLKPFKCEICGNSFSCRDYLYIHKNKTSCKNGDGRTRKNKRMKKTIKKKVNKGNSSTSKVENSKGPAPAAECEICEKFVTNLKQHMEHNHTTERKHMCHLCPKSFKSGANLKEHLKRHEDDGPHDGGISGQDVREFQCSVKGCRLRFAKTELLESHMKNRHGEDGEKEPELKCQYCGKGFHLKKNLKLHEECHENEGKDPYVCQVCGKGFKTMHYLKYHQKHTHKMKLEDGRKVSKR